jgi:predicted small lipoprotein YifL
MLARMTIALLAVVSLTAAACGLKGPLYRPDEPRDETVAPTEDAAGTTKKKNESGVAPPSTSIDVDRPAVPPKH